MSTVIPRDRDNNSILLARKARGFGLGKWMGFGGKVEPDETIDAGVLRELREETGVALQPNQIAKIGLLLFTFDYKPGYFLEVHVYETFSLTKIQTLCDEFEGEGVWYTKDDVPCKVRLFAFSSISSICHDHCTVLGGTDSFVETILLLRLCFA